MGHERAAARRAAVLAAAFWAAACQGPELPDAPNPPRIKRTPLPFPIGEPSPGATPGPQPTALQAPRDGQLARSAGGYLEFLPSEQNGRTVYFAFPYDSRLAGVRAAPSEGSAQATIDGRPFPMLAYLDEDRNLFFYMFPQVGAGAHQVEVAATVRGVSWSGSFTAP